MTLTDRDVIVPSPIAIIMPNKTDSDSSGLSSPQSLFSCPSWPVAQPLQSHSEKANWKGSLEGKAVARVGGVDPHELLFHLFQEQMWYLGLAV